MTKTIKCDYCKYKFISNVDKGITYCPKCKNMIKIGMESTSGILGKFRALPQIIKYGLIAALIVLLVVFGILPIFGLSLI